jgi:hypothetical protein
LRVIFRQACGASSVQVDGWEDGLVCFHSLNYWVELLG